MCKLYFDMLRIQEICKEKGITLQQLAHRLGITYQALYASIGGNPTLSRLQAIAKELDCNVSDLLVEARSTTFVCPNCGTVLKVEQSDGKTE